MYTASAETANIVYNYGDLYLSFTERERKRGRERERERERGLYFSFTTNLPGPVVFILCVFVLFSLFLENDFF